MITKISVNMKVVSPSATRNEQSLNSSKQSDILSVHNQLPLAKNRKNRSESVVDKLYEESKPNEIRSRGIYHLGSPDAIGQKVQSHIHSKYIINRHSSRASSLCARLIQRNNLNSTTNNKTEFSKEYARALSPFIGNFKSEFQSRNQNASVSPVIRKLHSNNIGEQEEDKTISVISKLRGWIYLSDKSKRNQRIGKFGPQENQELNLQDVSDLAPRWMHRRNIVDGSKITSLLPLAVNTRENKLMFLFESTQPKAIISVKTKGNDTIKKQNNCTPDILNTTYKPRIFFEWKEETNKQRYDKPITSKIGQIP